MWFVSHPGSSQMSEEFQISERRLCEEQTLNGRYRSSKKSNPSHLNELRKANPSANLQYQTQYQTQSELHLLSLRLLRTLTIRRNKHL